MTLELWQPFIDWLVPLAQFCVAATTVTHILLTKTNSRAAVGWIALTLVLPLFGSLVYWVLGVNRMVFPRPVESSPQRWPLRQRCSTVGATALEAVGLCVTGKPLMPGNQIRLLENGEQAFPAMLGAIADAQHEILLMTYIFEPDDVGQQFIAALQAAKLRGVRIGVLIDDVGRRHNFPTILPKLLRADLETRCFNPWRLIPPNLGVNLRNHRKMVIVDQRIGYSGGMNIGSRHLVSRASRNSTSDLCFEFGGPIVAAMREVFVRDWNRCGDANLSKTASPKQVRSTGGRSRLISDGPDEELDNLTLTIMGVVSTARQRIVLITPYFLPNSRIFGALQAAAMRGVEVNVIIPARCNWPMVRWALNHRIAELQRVGVTFFEQAPPFAHGKCLLIDSEYALVGSANLDDRSLRLNFELGIEIFDTSFCETLERYVLRCLATSNQLTSMRIDSRSTLVKLRDSLSNLFAPYL